LTTTRETPGGGAPFEQAGLNPVERLRIVGQHFAGARAGQLAIKNIDLAID
jgi:hypothetical protein